MVHGGSMVVFKTMTQKVRVAVERLLHAGLRAVSVVPNGHKPCVFATLVSHQVNGEVTRSDYTVMPGKVPAVVEQLSLSSDMYDDEEDKYLFVTAVSDNDVGETVTYLPWDRVTRSIDEHNRKATK